MTAIDRIDHIVITTANIDACVRFYVDALGLELDDSNGRYAFRTGRHKINVHRGKAEFLPAARAPDFGSSNFCLASAGTLRPYLDRLKKHGIPLINQTTYARNGARGPMESVYVRDPDNNLVEISGYGTNEGGDTLALDHLVLNVARLRASINFYENFLGMKCLRYQDTCTASFPKGKINLHMGEPPFAPARKNVFPGSGDFCLITKADIQSVYVELRAKSAPFESEAGIVERTGATGTIDSIYLRDPDGNLVEISAYR